MAAGTRRLGDLLILAGKVTQEQLDQAVEAQKETGSRLGSTLVSLGYLDDDELTRFLASLRRRDGAAVRQRPHPRVRRPDHAGRDPAHPPGGVSQPRSRRTARAARPGDAGRTTAIGPTLSFCIRPAHS